MRQNRLMRASARGPAGLARGPERVAPRGPEWPRVARVVGVSVWARPGRLCLGEPGGYAVVDVDLPAPHCARSVGESVARRRAGVAARAWRRPKNSFAALVRA